MSEPAQLLRCTGLLLLGLLLLRLLHMLLLPMQLLLLKELMQHLRLLGRQLQQRRSVAAELPLSLRSHAGSAQQQWHSSRTKNRGRRLHPEPRRGNRARMT